MSQTINIGDFQKQLHQSYDKPENGKSNHCSVKCICNIGTTKKWIQRSKLPKGNSFPHIKNIKQNPGSTFFITNIYKIY